MSYERERAVKTVCIILSVVLTVVLAVLIYIDKKEAKEAEAKLNEIYEKARPYEFELGRLEKELLSLEKEQHYVSENAELAVGFLVYGKADMAYARDKAEMYSICPVLVLDCTAESMSITECLEDAQAEWEIMLYAPEYSAETDDRVSEIRERLADMGKHDSGVFFLKRYSDTEENIDMLKGNGFIGYTVYHEFPSCGQRDDGMVYFDYSLVVSNNTNIAARLYDCYGKRASMIFVFDIRAMHSGALTDGAVCDMMDALHYYADMDGCGFASVSEVTAELSDINRIEAEKKAENEERTAEIRDQIKQCRERIDEIWAEWYDD